ncbi:MAG TPA: hypothetical protein VMT88_02785 [Actinomycetes bacterium]|nr:hypothetical protein [Actinomycetes bacterium]
MNQVMQPHHMHQRKVWLVPDSTLGRWTAAVFTAALLTVVVVPLLAQAVTLLVEPGSDTAWFFAFWGTMLLALGLALVTGVAAIVALVRDHALLLLVPVVLGIVGTGLLFTSAGWPV